MNADVHRFEFELVFICVHLRPSVVQTKWCSRTNDSQFLLKNETHQIIGSAMEVLNEIGHGFHEKIYENALVVEFGLRQIAVSQQPDFPVTYKSVIVGSYVPDLICFGLVVADAKTIEEITDYEIGKMLNYLKVTNLQVGLLINFKHPKLEFKRVARS
jgi:GxxExxY protein